jgi:hypothetical protein
MNFTEDVAVQHHHSWSIKTLNLCSFKNIRHLLLRDVWRQLLTFLRVYFTFQYFASTLSLIWIILVTLQTTSIDCYIMITYIYIYMFTIYWHMIRCLWLYNIITPDNGYNRWPKRTAGALLEIKLVCKRKAPPSGARPEFFLGGGGGWP